MAELRPQVAPRYTRAVHIRRDFHDLRYRLEGYQVTPLVLQLAGRVLASLRPEATERAFSIVGPFGSGKSAFGLFLAHFLQRHTSARRLLLHSLHVADAAALLPEDAPSLLAVLVPGNNSPLRREVLLALHHALEQQRSRVPAFDEFLAEVAQAADDPELDPQRVADLVARASQLLGEQGHFHGVLLLIDELGQFLDHAARHDDERDLFVLQSLAEMASRTGVAPCVVLTILHQAFERYTFSAGATRRIEWAKVQGRFQDLAFQEPASQMVRMVAKALQPGAKDPWRAERAAWAERVAPVSLGLGLRPLDISQEEWRELIAASYPLHPTVLLALPHLFRQLAQNERSLFAFLHSDEPHGLRETLRGAAPGATPRIYRLTDLYSYIETTLGPSLFGRARGQRWAELAEARALLGDADPQQLDVLTVIGTIGALERSAGLRASKEQVAFALADEVESPQAEPVMGALDALARRSLITYRRHRDSYIIWEGSDLDLDAMTSEQRQELGERAALPALLQRHADVTPRIARRHSYRTGSTRTFAVRYIGATELGAAQPLAGYDGELLHVVPADDQEIASAERWALDPARRDEPQRIVVLPRRISELREVLLDVAALRELLEGRPELESDRPARREVASRLLEAQQALGEAIATTYGPGSRWYHLERWQEELSARQVDMLLSAASDATYPEAPRVWNELIVRRQLSSAAAKARRNLVEALLERGGEENLGLSGYPPERAIYESVLRHGGLHRQGADGQWRVGPPPEHDPLRLRPAWAAMERWLDEAQDMPRPLRELYITLESAPYGVKAGLTPLLFVALYVARAGEMVLYERGSYAPLPDMALFERLLTRPEQFALRLSRADGSRLLVYQRLARALAPSALDQPVQPALLAVTLPLLRLMRGLPEYSRQTREVSQVAQALRGALREARSPDELLFERLPLALDSAPFPADAPTDEARVEAFSAALRASLQELQAAYPALLRRVFAHIRAAFGLAASDSVAARAELQERYAAIAATTNDSGLRALGVRLETADEGGDAWVESVAALVARRPPELWADGDARAFEVAVAELGRRFRAAEELALVARELPAEAPVLRIGLANGHGELSRVVRAAPHDPAVARLRDELGEALGRHAGLSTDQRAAALAALLESLLAPQPETEEAPS